MAFFETRQQREARLARDNQRYPELQFSDPNEILRIDRSSLRQGFPVTTLGQTSLNTFARAGVPPEERQEIERQTAQDVFESQIRQGGTVEPTPSPIAIQSFRERMGFNDEDEGGGNFFSRALDVGTRNPFTPLGIARGIADTTQNIGQAGIDLVQGDAPSVPNPLDILEGGVVGGVNTARNLSAPTQAIDLVRDRQQAQTLSDVPGTLLGGLQDVDTVTGLPIRTPIRQGSQALTDPAGALRDQFEQEQQGGIGFGLEGAAPFEQLRRIPGIEADIPGTEISAFDVTLGLSDALLDVGGVAGLSQAGQGLLRRTAVRSVFPGLSDDTVRLASVAGASAPSQVVPDMARTIARGPAAQNAAETAQRTGNSVGSEVLRTLDAADVIVKQDKPGAIGELLNQIPGLREIRAFDQPRFALPDDILESAVGRQMAVAEYHTRALPTRVQAYRSLDNVFGEGASEGVPVAVRFLGDDDGYPAIGTVYDMFQRPDLYDLSDAQRAAIRQIDTRNLDLRTLANEGYDTDIGRFVSSREGSAYLPNVDASDAAEQLRQISGQPGTRTVTGIKSKPRVFDTGHDRWVNDTARVGRGELTLDQVFVPETDMRRLLTSLDGQKANAVGTSVWKQGLPGRTLVEAKEAVAPRLVEARNGLRRQIDSLRGKIRRAEASMSRDSQTSRVLERQIASNDDRIGRVVSTAEQAEDGLPELDALRGIIDELELRQASLNEAISGPSQRFSRQALRSDALREELAGVLDEYNDVRRAYEAVNLRGEQFVGDGIYRYFPAEQASQLRDLSRVSGNRVFELMARANATVLSGDFSPAFGIQGQLAFLLRPVDTTIKMFGGLSDPTGAFKLGNLADDIAADPDGWARFSMWMGRPVAGTSSVPDELAGGFLGRLPGFNEANEGMYRVALRRMKDDFDWFAQRAIADGATPDEAYAASIDVVTKVFPTLNPSRLGQSAAQATAQRAPFTSIAFLRQPAALVAEGTKALMKTATFQPLTLREEFAREAVLRLVGTTVTTISVASYLDAQAKGLDATDHIQDNLKQARLPVPGTEFSLPVGAAFRGVYNAVRPRPVDVAGVGEIPLPFAGVDDFFKNRIAPVIATQVDIATDEDYYGNPIQTKDFPLNILEVLAYERNAVAPITAQGITENVLEGESPRVIAAEAAGDFLGGSLTSAPEFVQERQTQDAIARSQEWTDPTTGETFEVNSFEELSSRLGSVVAERLVTEAAPERLAGLQESQAEESRDEATGIDDPNQAFAQLDALGQERFEWAQNIQGRINTGELTLADARRLEKERGWGGEIAGVIRSFNPVFERGDPPPLESLEGVTDVNEARDVYFAHLDQHIDPDTGQPGDAWYDTFEPQVIAAMGTVMWERVQDNIGVRDRAPWQLERNEIRERLAATEFFEIRDEVWERVAGQMGFSDYADPDELRVALRQTVLARGLDPARTEIIVNDIFDGLQPVQVWRQVSNDVEELWINANLDLARDALRAGYLKPGSLRSDEEAALLAGG